VLGRVIVAKAVDTFCIICCLDDKTRLKIHAKTATTSKPAQLMGSQLDERRLEGGVIGYIHVS
jgi:hypothetical protein